MPGVVTKVMVVVGDEVAKGQPLVAIEAMKMEHQIPSAASRPGEGARPRAPGSWCSRVLCWWSWTTRPESPDSPKRRLA